MKPSAITFYVFDSGLLWSSTCVTKCKMYVQYTLPNFTYLIRYRAIISNIKAWNIFILNEIRYHLYRHRILPWPCFILAENESVSNFIILCIKPPPNNPYMLLVCMYKSLSNFQHHSSSILRFQKREYVTYLVLY